MSTWVCRGLQEFYSLYRSTGVIQWSIEDYKGSTGVLQGFYRVLQKSKSSTGVLRGSTDISMGLHEFYRDL